MEKMHKPASRSAGLNGREKGFGGRMGSFAVFDYCLRGFADRGFASVVGALLLLNSKRSQNVVDSNVSVVKFDKCEDETFRRNGNILRHRPPHVDVPRNHMQRPEPQREKMVLKCTDLGDL